VTVLPVPELDTCGCCEQRVPRPHVYNRPGLAELDYRVGVHGTFLRRMLALLPNWPPRFATAGENGDQPDGQPLSRLTTRSGDDPSIAILDVWATLADVLTFYQERIANEGFLRTATERRSVLELARTIGYELNPGVAAGTFVAFTVEDREPPPGIPPVLQSVVAKGTKVQSMPAQGQLPQTFETSSELVARPEFNELRPRLTMPQPVSLGSTELFVAGVATGLNRGDRILITGPPQDPNDDGVQTSVLEITAVEPDSERSRTRIALSAVPKLPPPARPPAPTPEEPVKEFDFTPPPPPPIPSVAPPEIDPPVFALLPRPLTAEEIAQRILEYHWNNALLLAQLGIFGWGIGALIDHIKHRRFELDLGPVFEWVEVTPARDTKRPTVVSVFPANGTENVHPETTPMVTFGEPMDEALVKTATKLLKGTQEVAVTKTYKAATGTLELDPGARLDEAWYTIVVETSATDTADPGNPLAAELRSQFRVADFTPPQVVERYPDPDADPNTDPDKDVIDVPAKAEITVTFSEDVQGVDETSFYVRDSTGIVVPADVALTSQNTKIVLTPKRPLALSTQYTVTLTSKITDVPTSSTGTPNPAKAEEWTFTTADRPVDAPAKDLAVYAFRERAAFFGHNAPKWESLPKPTQQTPQRGDDPYPNPWDAPPRPVWVDSQGSTYGGDTVYLDRPVPALEPRSWAILESVDGLAPYFVTKIAEESIADYAISGRGSRMTLSQRDGTSPSVGIANPPDFKTRETAALVASERLVLVELPIEQHLEKGDKEILLDELVVGLTAGQPIALRGELVDLPGVIGDEILVLEDSFHSGGFTNLVLRTPLERSYLRKTATLNANVVAATHGETVRNEILGGGDGAQANQRFAIRKPPLTYVSASTPSGSESTLKLWIDGIRWDEAPNLYELGPRDERYIIRTDDEGTTRVIFGDGERGARPPTGTENVVATYRTGIGSPGLVGDERITLLQERPLGIQSVTNPLPPAGAEDREHRDSARVNAPLTVLTMDRIVSLSDFEDFSRAFAGIGKAQAVAIRRGQDQLVHLTVAAANGDEIARTSELFDNLVKTIESSRDPGVVVEVDSYRRMYFNVGASLVIDPRHVADDVLRAAESALLETFSFERRAFGQPVTAAEVVTVIQQVPGVVAVDLDELYRVDEDAPATAVVGLDQVITVDRARLEGAKVLPAQLLMVNPGGIKLVEGVA
jgi:hypothetical protein